MNVLVGCNSLYVLEDCINSVENPAVSICCASPVVQGGSNMTGTDLCVNKPHCVAPVRP